MALVVFLRRNRLWLFANDDELYEMTIYTAQSNARDKEQIVAELKYFINKRLWSISKFQSYFERMIRRKPFRLRHHKRRGKKV